MSQSLRDRIARVKSGESLNDPSEFTNAMDTGTVGSGAELQPDMTARTQQALGNVGVFRNLAFRIPDQKGAPPTRVPVVSTRLTAGVVSEAAPIVPADPVMDAVQLSPVKHSTNTIASGELDSDTNLREWFAVEMATALARSEDTEAVKELDASLTNVVSVTDLASVTLANVGAAISALGDTARQPTWVMSQQAWGKFWEIQAATGFVSSMVLGGYPVRLCGAMERTATSGQVLAVLADWEGATLFETGAVRIGVDNESLAHQDEIRLFGHVRSDFKVSKTAPLPIVGISVT